MQYDESEIDAEVDDIISQIKNQSKILKKPESEKISLEKDDMENFIIQNAANVVKTSVEMVESLKLEVLAGADSKLIESVSELVKATTSAIDALSKLKIAEDKLRSQKEITQMNIDAKQTSTQETQGFLLSREEVIQALMNKKEDVKTIDV